jgi:AcrR family transcriptional regulator
LLEAAAEVFAEQGFSGASIQAIAARAGVTSATIYRHFDSKADLLLGVVEEEVHAIPLAEHRRAGGADPLDSFGRLVATYAEPARRQIRRLAIELHAAASRDPAASELLLAFNQRVHADLARRLRDGVAAGVLPPDLAVERAASLLLVVVMGLCHLDTLEPRLLGDAAWRRFLASATRRLLGGRSS